MDNVHVPFGDKASDTATLLLAAAEEKGLEPSVVEVSSLGAFSVPTEVAEAAGLGSYDPDDDDGSIYSDKQVEQASKESVTPEVEGQESESKPAKKAAAKKTTAKKAGN